MRQQLLRYVFIISTETGQSDADDLRKRIMSRMNIKSPQEPSLDIPNYDDLCKVSPGDDSEQRNRRQKLAFGRKKEQDLSSVKIKTLAEIRAEKKVKEEQEKKLSSEAEISSTNSEVTSTSRTEEMSVDNVSEEIKQSTAVKRKSDACDEEVVRKRPKLRRPQLTDSDNTVSSVESEKELNSGAVKRKDKMEASKLDEMLLLDEDDLEYNTNVSLQAEEDLLKDIDELLSE